MEELLLKNVKKQIPAEKKLVRFSYEEWKKIGIEKFGRNSNHWKFKCPNCGESQTLGEFINNKVDEPLGKFYFSCIGRWVNGRGCDWTLGGLFQIHTTEVIHPDGSILKVFEFDE